MWSRRLFPLLILAVLASSCRPTKPTVIWQGGPGQSQQTSTPKSSGNKSAENRNNANNANKPYKMSFTAAESAHVKAQGIHKPLSAQGLTIPLIGLRNCFCYPYDGHKTSEYGPRGGSMHTGIDIKAPAGAKILAVMDGVVRMSKMYSSYGNVVVIRHYNGLETLYSHNTKNLVKVNEAVKAGQPIALAGRTGRATGDHLHFEVRVAGEHINPNLLLDCGNRCLRPDTLYVRNVNGTVVATNDYYQIGSPSDTPTYTPTSRSAASKGKSKNKTSYHTVKKGDTLFSISRKYSTTVDSLRRINGIGRDNTIYVGQKLRVK